MAADRVVSRFFGSCMLDNLDLIYKNNKNGFTNRRGGENPLPLAIGERPLGVTFLTPDKKDTK